MRRSFKPIHYRRAESPRGNAFCSNDVETECIEFAQVPEEIGGCFEGILFLAYLANGCESLG